MGFQALVVRRLLVLFVSVLAVPVLLFAPPAPAAALGLQTFVGAYGGQSDSGTSGCTMFGLPPGHTQLFGASSGVFVPVPGLVPCSVAGQFQVQTAAVGPIADATSIAVGFNAGANAVSGSSQATAQYGSLGAAAQAVFSGPSNGLIVHGTEAYAVVDDTLTFTSPSVTNGSYGTLALVFSVDGTLGYSTAAPFTSGTANLKLAYAKSGGGAPASSGTVLNANVASPGATPSVYVEGGSLVGISQAPGSVIVDADLSTVLLPFYFGAAFDLSVGLQAWAQPGPDGTVDAAFASTAVLSAIHVFGSGGAPVTDFAVTSGSGSLYTANGVLPVPEPGRGALALPVLLAARAARRRRARR